SPRAAQSPFVPAQAQSPFVPAKAGTQTLALDSRLRGNERSLLLKRVHARLPTCCATSVRPRASGDPGFWRSIPVCAGTNGVRPLETLPRADSAPRRLARHRGSAPNRVRHSYSLVKQPNSFPRRVFCARGLFFASLTRNEGWAEHRETYGRSCEAPVRRVRTRQALVRRLASLVRGPLASRR